MSVESWNTDSRAEAVPAETAAETHEVTAADTDPESNGAIETAEYQAERTERLAELKAELEQSPSEEAEIAASPDRLLEEGDGHERMEVLREEIATHHGVDYPVRFVGKESLFPAFGLAVRGGKDKEDVAYVREDLPPRVKAFVRSHELYHLGDEKMTGTSSWLMDEFRANFYPGIKDPTGLLLTVIQTLRQEGRLNTYKQLLRKNFDKPRAGGLKRLGGKLGSSSREDS